MPAKGLTKKNMIVLDRYIENITADNKNLTDINKNDIKLAALLFSFEQYYNRQQYFKALDVLPFVLLCV